MTIRKPFESWPLSSISNPPPNLHIKSEDGDADEGVYTPCLP